MQRDAKVTLEEFSAKTTNVSSQPIGTDLNAASLFDVGGALKGVVEACREVRCFPGFAHHAVKDLRTGVESRSALARMVHGTR